MNVLSDVDQARRSRSAQIRPSRQAQIPGTRRKTHDPARQQGRHQIPGIPGIPPKGKAEPSQQIDSQPVQDRRSQTGSRSTAAMGSRLKSRQEAPGRARRSNSDRDSIQKTTQARAGLFVCRQSVILAMSFGRLRAFRGMSPGRTRAGESCPILPARWQRPPAIPRQALSKVTTRTRSRRRLAQRSQAARSRAIPTTTAPKASRSPYRAILANYAILLSSCKLLDKLSVYPYNWL
jgi:hypothetical protein